MLFYSKREQRKIVWPERYMRQEKVFDFCLFIFFKMGEITSRLYTDGNHSVAMEKLIVHKREARNPGRTSSDRCEGLGPKIYP